MLRTSWARFPPSQAREYCSSGLNSESAELGAVAKAPIRGLFFITTSRRTVTKGIAWGVPAVIAAGAAPAFASSPVGGGEPTVGPTEPTCTPAAAVTGSQTLDLRTGGTGHTVSFADRNSANNPNGPGRTAEGLATLGNGNGIATVTFELPEDFASYTGVTLTMDYVGVNDPTSDDEIWYWVNEIPNASYDNPTVFSGMVTNSRTLQTGAVLSTADLQAGTNTITFGMPRRDSAPYLYMSAISQLNVSWTVKPAVTCP